MFTRVGDVVKRLKCWPPTFFVTIFAVWAKVFTLFVGVVNKLSVEKSETGVNFSMTVFFGYGTNVARGNCVGGKVACAVQVFRIVFQLPWYYFFIVDSKLIKKYEMQC